MTNGDRIRRMSNEELAKTLSRVCKICVYSKADIAEELLFCNGPCKEGIKAYLESEAE